MNHANKTALVTGATSGIGLAVTMELLRQGIKVLGAGRNFDSLQRKIISAGIDPHLIHFISADLRSEEELTGIADEVKHTAGLIHICIHSAGVIHDGLLEQAASTDLDHQYAVNVRAPYILSQKILPFLCRKNGIIIFINSTAGLDSWEGVSQYAASKHGLRAMAKSLRLELQPQGIRVGSIYPGGTATPMQKYIQNNKGAEYHEEDFLAPDIVASTIMHMVNLPPAASITDVTLIPFNRHPHINHE